MGVLVRLLGSGIGLASEALHNRKVSKAEADAAKAGESSTSRSIPYSTSDEPPAYAPLEYVEVPEDQAENLIAHGQAVYADKEYPDEKAGRNPYEDDDASSVEGDEEAWQLDETSRDLAGASSEDEGPPKQTGKLIDAFIRDHPAPAFSQRGQLPCPVILPQRRPGDKKRGFVRAYAPVLEHCGIDQATFLDFLKIFHESTQSDKWLLVVFLSAGIVGFVPGPITMGVSTAIQVSVGIAMEVQKLSRTNTFLDRINNEFFKPRGLYCLIMAYKPDATQTHEQVDINEQVMKYSTDPTSTAQKAMRSLRASSGKTYGEYELPEAAPLIFPTLDRLADDPAQLGAEKKKSTSQAREFVLDYLDRRGQAKYAMENPGSKLSVGSGPVFNSRYADPSHPASSGSLISLLTGGARNPQERRNQKKVAKRMRKAQRRGEPITNQTGKKKDGLVRRTLKSDVLYLMIVNMPTEEEMAAGRQAVHNEQQARMQTPAYRY